MKTKTLILASTTFWVLVCYYNENTTLAGIVIVGHTLFWTLHRIEVKLNRLLDDRGIRVTEAEMAE